MEIREKYLKSINFTIASWLARISAIKKPNNLKFATFTTIIYSTKSKQILAYKEADNMDATSLAAIAPNCLADDNITNKLNSHAI